MWARGRARGRAAALIIGCVGALGFGAAPAHAIGLDAWNGPGTVNETTGGSTATFTAVVACGTLDIGTSRTYEVSYDFGTASPADVGALSSTTVTIRCTALGNGANGTITFPVIDDALHEADETLSLVLSQGGTEVTRTAMTIHSDDAAPQASVSSPTVNEAAGTANFVVTIPESGLPASYDYAIADGTATSPADYTKGTGTAVTFQPGETSKNLTVTIADDAIDEYDETLKATVTGRDSDSAVDEATKTGTMTVTDNDVPTFTIAATGPTEEGNSGTTPVGFTITRSIASTRTLQLKLSTADGTATAPTDYVAQSNTVVTIAPGEGSKPVTVNAVGDAVDEPDETFTVALNAGGDTSITVNTTPVTGTIVDDDVPNFTIAQTSTPVEGNGGTTPIAFTVHRSIASTRTLSVLFSTGNGTATTPADYQPRINFLVTFAPGDTDKVVTVDAVGDVLDEDDETFTLTLSRGADTSITVAGPATGTIKDDDAAPVSTISINPSHVAESGTATLSVALSAASGRTVKVGYTLGGGSATDGSDYEGSGGTVTFAAGGPTTKTITVPIVEDTVDEFDETFDATPTAPDATSTAGPGTTVTIDDDDAAPTATVADATGSEGSGYVFLPVTLSAPSGKPIELDYAVGGGTATAGSDYDATPGHFAINPGDTSGVVVVPVVKDDADEGDETFDVTLTSPDDHVVPSSTPGRGTITNTAAAPVKTATTATTAVAATATAAASATSRPTGPGPKATLGRISYRRGRASVSIGCPAAFRTCRVTVSLTSVANSRSKVKEWRKARRLGQRLLVVPGGKTASQTFTLSARDLKLLNRAKKIGVRALAVAVDDYGRVGSTSVAGTLKR